MDYTNIDDLFLKKYPEGLNDPAVIEYLKIFKTPKKISDLFSTDLSESTMSEMLEIGEYETITQSILKIINSANVLSRFEKVAFNNFVKDSGTHQHLAYASYDLLYHFSEDSFNQIVNVLSMHRQDKSMDVLKWPVITLFNSYRDGYTSILVKPNTVKKISKALNIDISYTPKPNYTTYIKILDMIKNYKVQSTICSDCDFAVAQAIMFMAVD